MTESELNRELERAVLREKQNGELAKEALNQLKMIENECHRVVDELEQYRAIGTVSEFRELKEKATAKPVNRERGFDKCPNCGEVLNDECGEQYKFCPDCGQKLLWD